MNIPSELLYTKSHEWVRMNGEDGARIGLTDFAQESLGDIVYVGLPGVGDALTLGESFGEVESVKAVSEVYAPVSGTVSAVNAALEDAPETVNDDPYEAWLIEVEGITGKEELLDAAAYEAHCAAEA